MTLKPLWLFRVILPLKALSFAQVSIRRKPAVLRNLPWIDRARQDHCVLFNPS